MTPHRKNIHQRISQVLVNIEAMQQTTKKCKAIPYDMILKLIHIQMIKAGIVMIPDICELSQNGFKAVVKMAISFVNVDNPADKIQVNSMGYGVDHIDSGIGKAVLYAVQYAQIMIFSSESRTNAQNENNPHKPQKTDTISREQLDEVLQLAKVRPKKLKKVLDLFKIEDASQIPINCYERIIAALKRYEPK